MYNLFDINSIICLRLFFPQCQVHSSFAARSQPIPCRERLEHPLRHSTDVAALAQNVRKSDASDAVQLLVTKRMRSVCVRVKESIAILVPIELFLHQVATDGARQVVAFLLQQQPHQQIHIEHTVVQLA